MNNKKILFTAFIIVSMVQLFVPTKMIIDKEIIMGDGVEYKFKMAPIDPSDPFRGKYITLSFDESSIEIEDEDDWMRGEIVYASIAKDTDGFARLKSVSKTKPIDNQDFVEAKVSFVTENGSNMLTIDYPFDRYYMEESKAYNAELIYRQFQLDTNQITYALVSVKGGEAVLKDVLINGTSIKEIVKANRKK